VQLRLEDVGHRFGERPWLFRHVTLTLLPGHSYALVGPSGSGKTTMLGLIAGFSTPQEGSVSREGIARTSWVFQNPHGVPRRQAIDHVALPLLAAGHTLAAAAARAEVLMARVGIGGLAHQEFRALSGGEAQRLMLARALAAAPALLLIDEPTAQLDQATAGEVDAAVQALTEEGVIVVVATHDARTRDACTDILDLATPAYRAGSASGPERADAHGAP